MCAPYAVPSSTEQYPSAQMHHVPIRLQTDITAASGFHLYEYRCMTFQYDFKEVYNFISLE